MATRGIQNYAIPQFTGWILNTEGRKPSDLLTRIIIDPTRLYEGRGNRGRETGVEETLPVMLDERNRHGRSQGGQEEAPLEVVRRGKVRRSLQRTRVWRCGVGVVSTGVWWVEGGQEKVGGGTELLEGTGRKKLKRTGAALYSGQWWNRRKVSIGMMTILAGMS